MYEPSENFYNKVIKQQVRHVFWSGKIVARSDSYYFTAEDIVKDSGTITNEIASGEMEIGTVYSSELIIGLYVDEIGIPRNELYGAVIELYCTISHGETLGTCPMGKFDIVEATQNGNVCTITAYDFMNRFNKEYPAASGNNKPYDWAQIFCNACNVTLAQSNFDNLANSDLFFTLVWTDNIDTYRDALGQLAGALGCSAHMNRFGQLEFVPLKDKEAVTTIGLKDRFGSDIAQTIWEVNSICVIDTETGAAHYWGYGALMLDLGENSFLQHDGEIRDITWTVTDTKPIGDMLLAIFMQVFCAAVPVETEIPLDPCLDLFDYVQLANAGYKTLVTSLIHKIGGGTKLSCAGANTTYDKDTSTRGTSGSDEQQMWVTSASNNSAIAVGTQALTWREARKYDWNGVSAYTWGDIMSGGIPTVVAEAIFTPPKEMNRGVVSFTVNYILTEDAKVQYIIRVDGNAIWTLEETQAAGEVVKTITTPIMLWDRETTRHRINALIMEVEECSI